MDILHILFAADEAFALPLAVAVRSLVTTLAPCKKATLWVADYGLSEASRSTVAAAAGTHTLRWLPMGAGETAEATWGRVDALPILQKEGVARVLYLDADTLIREDVSELWAVPFDGVAAVVDVGLCSAERPNYLNAGVLLLDLNHHAVHEIVAKRSSTAAAAATATATATATTATVSAHKDQDLINGVLQGRWTRLDMAWNAQGLGSYLRYRTKGEPGRPALLTPSQCTELETGAAIVHFTGTNAPGIEDVLSKWTQIPTKPWSYACSHPFRKEYMHWYEAAKMQLQSIRGSHHEDTPVKLAKAAASKSISDYWQRVQPTSSVSDSGTNEKGVCVITGGAGFLGSHLAPALIAEGWHVRIVDDLSRGHRENIPPGGEFVQADLTDWGMMNNALQGASMIVHLASVVGGVNDIFDNEEEVFWRTLQINLNVHRFAREAQVPRLIYTTTACCFAREHQSTYENDGGENVDADAGAGAGADADAEGSVQRWAVLSEQKHLLPAHPESSYGWSKLIGEIGFDYLQKDVRSNVRVQTVRLHNLYGERMPLEGMQVVPNLIHKLLVGTSNELEVLGSGKQYRDFLYVADATRGIMEMIRNPEIESTHLGTGKPTAIRDLANVICEIHKARTGKVVTPRFLAEGREGDKGRVADIREAHPGWHAKTTLVDGITRCYDDISRRLAGTRTPTDGSSTLALVLPLTSRGQPSPIELTELVLPERSTVYVVVDVDDPEYGTRSEQWFSDQLRSPCVLRLVQPQRPVPIYRIYNTVVRQALRNGHDYFVLWGNDISTTHASWLDDVEAIFRGFAERDIDPIPFGYGCVALNDSKNPGFPSFPVVHRHHIETFGGFCPPAFVNQDGDPWVFELYRSFGTSAFAETVNIRNEIGGASDVLGIAVPEAGIKGLGLSPRYKRTAVPWKDRAPDDVAVVLNAAGMLTAPKVTVDVVVPTYRTNMDILTKIVSMDVPVGSDVMFIIVVDDPDTPRRNELSKLALLPHRNIRVRFNAENVGVSVTRNRGIDESAAEWILFIDDDVDVAPNLLSQYVAAIRERGDRASGFVGLTTFPQPVTAQQAGTHMSYITYFWDVANRMRECPWGVTANLLLRRTPVRFDADFIKTGGGEDIAMCIDTATFCDKPLLAAPAAHAVHPWWGGINGGIDRMRFFNWTQGDGLLSYKYPQLSYTTAPNVIELSLLALLLLPWSPFLSCAWLFWMWACEIGMDIHHYMFVDCKIAGHERGWRRVLCSLEATLVKAVVEAGHAWVHLKRGRPDMLLRRFDWYCGLDASAIQQEKAKANGRLAGFVFPFLVVCAYSWCATVHATQTVENGPNGVEAACSVTG